MKKHIPNLITACNLACGCIATVIAFKHTELLHLSSFFIILAAVFDFFDGFAARALNAYSAMGKELDSLADMVSFGFAPSVIVFSLISASAAEPSTITFFGENPLSYSAFIITIFSAFRLANFNVDTRQTDSFIGLATPANALFFLSFPLILHYTPNSIIAPYITNPYILIGLTIFMSFMMVAELPMFSFKFKSAGFKGNEVRFLFITTTIILGITLKFSAIPIIIFLYFITSISNNIVAKKQA